VSAAKRIGRLVVITDVHIQSRYSHEQIAELACAGGADVIQLRDKDLPDEDFLRIAKRVRAICRRYDVQFIINDRVELARAVEADGVHVGRSDMSAKDARELMGDKAIIGTSAGSAKEAKEAEIAGADYIGFGHIFATSSKTKATPPVGLAGLRAACQAVKLPVIAIGGITEKNVADVIRAGAHGIAVIAAVCAADYPRAAAARLRTVIDSGSEAGR
jgi:thiamine-phosphate pyrophosphorylase